MRRYSANSNTVIACPSNLMQDLLSKYLSEPYSYNPDLAGFDFWLFLKLKYPFKEQISDRTRLTTSLRSN